jgi:hypothetical protein
VIYTKLPALFHQKGNSEKCALWLQNGINLHMNHLIGGRKSEMSKITEKNNMNPLTNLLSKYNDIQ